MVGKIKHVRQKIHQEAVKLRPSGLAHPRARVPASPAENERIAASKRVEKALPESPFPAGIFAGTEITPEALVQTLKFDTPPDTPDQKGGGERKVKSKKEKMKERRERWLNKISSIKLAKEQQAAKARRQAAPVVGDMRPLADALPELSLLIAPAATAPTARRKSRKNKAPVKRPDPTDFSQMKRSQKRKLLETESLRFSDAVKTLSAKMNPLADIAEQLRKRMRQEEEQGPG
ncbi:ribosome biogenesis protein SLX9 homolog [Brachionichthys hirsutus]|uniref:ribosome biogenesis protein SLX9 homolog n=1 Tax=Brachionichthys hirsutus TaxID=412623 RepID=UPI0036047E36